MATSAHARVLEGLIDKLVVEVMEAMSMGNMDYPQYRQTVGVIQGLRDARRLSQEADLKLSGGLSVSA
jgi:hypothetical protein